MSANGYYIINLSSDGQGQVSVNLGSTMISLITRYNYLASCWEMDILDVNGDLILAGLMLVPGIDLLAPYQEYAKTIGGLVLAVKNSADYQDPAGLGTSSVLLWFPPGVPVQIPIPSGGW